MMYFYNIRMKTRVIFIFKKKKKKKIVYLYKFVPFWGKENLFSFPELDEILWKIFFQPTYLFAKFKKS